LRMRKFILGLGEDGAPAGALIKDYLSF